MLHNVKVWCDVVDTAYLKPGGDATLSCNIVRLQLLVEPTRIVYKWINRNGLDMEENLREGGRIKVTSLYQLKITNAFPEDSDNYFCIVSLVYPDHVVNFTNEMHFKGYLRCIIFCSVHLNTILMHNTTGFLIHAKLMDVNLMYCVL